jgi:membrane protease YdiL (CAAX protease family)
MISNLPLYTDITPDQNAVVIPVVLTIVCFIIYWFTAQSEKIKLRFYKHADFDKASANHILFTKLFGFLIMGIVPVFTCVLFIPQYPFSFYALTFRSDTSLFSLLWIAIISAVLIPVTIMSARKPKNLMNYPQIRAKVWSVRTVIINIIGWSLYLLGYELLFRGVLLMPLADQLGVWPAIAINTAFYSATHIPKGLEETIGAIPLGLVLCLLTIASGTIWIAFFVHLVMALTNSFAALKFHPDIHYFKNKTYGQNEFQK